MQSSLLERQMQGVALQTAFRILPVIAAKQVVFSCKVKQLPERSLLFSAADDRRWSGYRPGQEDGCSACRRQTVLQGGNRKKFQSFYSW